jgi:hypothetical protein
MKHYSDGSSFPNFRSSHPPGLNPSASEQQHPPYISSQRPSHDLFRYYTNDTHHNQTLTQAVATSYPESSQRTIMRNSPYPSDYGTRDFQCSDIMNDQATAYTSLGDSDLDRISFDFISQTGRRQPMSEQDVRHFQQELLAAPSSHHHIEHGLNPATVEDPTSHPVSCELTYSNRVASRAPETASKRQILMKATGLQARHRPGYGPEDLMHLGTPNRDSHNSNAAILPTPLPSIPMSNNRDESQASSNTSYERTHCSSDGFPCATSDRESMASTGSHEAFDEFSSSSVSKKRRSKMHECEVCGKMFPRYVFLDDTHFLKY